MKKILLLLLSFAAFYQATPQVSFYQHEKINIPLTKIPEISISNNGKFLAYSTLEGRVIVWDIKASRQIYDIGFHQKEVTSLKFDQQNEYLVASGNDEIISVWDMYSGTKTQDIEVGIKVKCQSISPDNHLLVVSGMAKELLLFDFPSLNKRGELKSGHKKKGILFCAFNSNGDQIVSVGEDNKMIFWNPNNLSIIRETNISPNTLNGSGIEVTDVKLSSDSKIICVAFQETILAKGGNKMIFKYNLAFYDWNTGKLLQVIENNACPINTMDFTPDKKFVVTNNSTLRETKLSFWNVQNGLVDQNYSFDELYKISKLAISNDGSWLAVGMNDSYPNAVVQIFELSGIDGFERFDYSNQLEQSQGSNMGSSIRLTTPKEPLINIGEKRKMAVMYLDAVGAPEDVAKSASYLLESKLGNSSKLILVERNQIDQVLDEMKYQMSGMTASDAVKVGKQLNAHFVLIGSLNKLGNLLIITTKVVNVETGQIEGSREVECSNATIEDISQMVMMLAPTITVF
ncbi:MAG: hypothetical protein K9H16_00875 [Bacteroidales bacterium]|nr:hypothetical protein [Bacteroidales bacterium]